MTATPPPPIRTKDQPTLGEYLGAGAAGIGLTIAGIYGSAGTRIPGLDSVISRLPEGLTGGDVIQHASWAGSLAANAVGVPAKYAFGLPLAGPALIAAYRFTAVHANTLSNTDLFSKYVVATAGVGIAGLVGICINAIRKKLKGTV